MAGSVTFLRGQSVMMARSIANALSKPDAGGLSNVVRIGIDIATNGTPERFGWRATHPMDDPAIPADLWINEAFEVWIKADTHEPWEPKEGVCSWCSSVHAGPVTIFTVMRPEDY